MASPAPMAMAPTASAPRPGLRSPSLRTASGRSTSMRAPERKRAATGEARALGARRVAHTFTVTVEQDDGQPGTDGDGTDGFGPAAGVTVTVTEDGVGSIDFDESTCDDAVTDSSGHCLVATTAVA